LVVLGEVLEAVLVGYSIGLGLEPRVSLTKFSDHRHLLLRGDETLNLPLGEPDLFHRGHTRRPLRACRKRPRDRRASEQRDEPAAPHQTTAPARRKNDPGMGRSIALAVLRLMITATRVEPPTGRRAGLALFRILPPKAANRR